MYFPRFAVVKLILLMFDRIFLNIENELSTSTEVIVHTSYQKFQIMTLNFKF